MANVEKNRITVVKGKGSVQVLDWGRAPFGVERTKRGNAFIPTGFKIRCKSDSQYWIGETNVNKDLQPQYQFTLEKDSSVQSGWFPTSTAAYNEANRLAKNDKFNKGSNGRLIIGLTYPVLQEIICRMNNLPYNLIMSPSESPRSLPSRQRSSSREVEEKEPDSPKRTRQQHFELNGNHAVAPGSQLQYHRVSFNYPQDHLAHQGYVQQPATTFAGSLMEPVALASFSSSSSSVTSQAGFTHLTAPPHIFTFDDDTLFLLENLTTDDILGEFEADEEDEYMTM